MTDIVLGTLQQALNIYIYNWKFWKAPHRSTMYEKHQYFPKDPIQWFKHWVLPGWSLRIPAAIMWSYWRSTQLVINFGNLITNYMYC